MSEATMVAPVSKAKKTVLKGDFKPMSRDRFGCHLGADSARINAELSVNESITIAQIAKNLGLTEERVQYHFDVWTTRNRGVGPYLMKLEDGSYKLREKLDEVVVA